MKYRKQGVKTHYYPILGDLIFLNGKSPDPNDG